MWLGVGLAGGLVAAAVAVLVLRRRVRPAYSILDRRVAQQQPLDALAAEVDRGDGLVRCSLHGDHGAEAERVVLGPGHRVRATGPRGSPSPSTPRPRGRRRRRSCGGRPPWESPGASAGGEVGAVPLGLGGLGATPVDEVDRHLVEEPRGRVVGGGPPGRAHHGARQVEPLLSTRDADVRQASLLLQLGLVTERAGVRGRRRPRARSGTPPGTPTPWRCGASST